MNIQAIYCWIKGFGVGPGGRSWWDIRYNLLHPRSNSGSHKDEKINYHKINGVTYFDFRCKRCGRISDNWQGVTDANAREVVADFYMNS
jgi:hypothetical protein